MEWNINTLGRVCAVSNEPFEEGDSVVCFIYRDGEGQVQRVDVGEAMLEQFEIPPGLLGRWGRVVKSRGDQAREARDQALASAEELFMSLFEQQGEEAERDTFKLVLALYLERKRIVRREGRTGADGLQQYLHVKTRQTFPVLMDDPQPSLLLALQTQLEMLLV